MTCARQAVNFIARSKPCSRLWQTACSASYITAIYGIDLARLYPPDKLKARASTNSRGRVSDLGALSLKKKKKMKKKKEKKKKARTWSFHLQSCICTGLEGGRKRRNLFQCRPNDCGWTKIEICATHVCIVSKHQEWQSNNAKELTCHTIAQLSSFVSIKILRHAWIPDTGVILYLLNQFRCLRVAHRFGRQFDTVLIADWLLRPTSMRTSTKRERERERERESGYC